jgi:coenzyme F420-reducing hydrogenase alpha subunit
MKLGWKEIKVDYLSRVEGEAAFNIKVEDGIVKEVVLNVYEPMRFFEAFLRGKRFEEIPDIASRICGICYTAHQITALRAIENALGIEVSEQTKNLRDLLTIGGIIQSHILHLYFLAIPDYMGYESAIAMAGKHAEVVKRGLRLKKLGNDTQMVVGGRAIHPFTQTIGGFTSIPKEEQLKNIGERLREEKDKAMETVRIFKDFEIPNFERKSEHVALRSENYPLNIGIISSTQGLSCSENEYREYIEEKQAPPSHAKHSTIKGRDSFLVGPLARMNLNHDRISEDAKAVAEEVGVKFPNFNPFISNIDRAIEVVQYMDDAIDIIDAMELREEERKKIDAHAGEGCAVTEAPRGILYHFYEIRNGLVRNADIVTPTAHNVYNIENDLRKYAPTILDLPEKEATLNCEKLIRAYDPCFSCSVHLINCSQGFR